MRAALQSFSLLGRQLRMKDGVLLDWEKGPGMTILVHSAIKSEREDMEDAVENLRARIKEEKAEARDGGREGDENEDRDGGGGRMEWRRALEVDMVGGLEERADGLVLEVGEAKRTATRKVLPNISPIYIRVQSGLSKPLHVHGSANRHKVQ